MALERSINGFQGSLPTFGRHPHRNAVLGRPSTPSEEAYIATGDFPHVRKVAHVKQTDR